MHQVNRRQAHRVAGFTLIELLVVIGIIVILIGILLPVLAMMRKKAQATDTAAEMAKIATAINAYFTDFHAYPGPIPESQIYGYNNGTPSTTVTNATTVTSTENLTLGLLGGITNNGTTFTYTASLLAPPRGPQSLNPLNPKQNNVYLEVASSDLSTDPSGLPTSWTTIQPNKANYPSGLTVPEILDHFSVQHPIIYLRAVVGGNTVCDTPQSSTSPGSQYFTKEMSAYWLYYSWNASKSAVDYTTGVAITSTTNPISTLDSSQNPLYTTPKSFFQNPTLNDGITPRAKDGFLLISPGADGIYGTADDILNPPN